MRFIERYRNFISPIGDTRLPTLLVEPSIRKQDTNMDVLNLDYSTKNIPYPSIDSYRKDLISRTISFIQRLRWKANFFLKGTTDKEDTKQTYGFKSQKTPPACKHLRHFEDSLFDMIKELNFVECPNEFQDKMGRDIRKIKSSKNIFVKADKSDNIYEIPTREYKELVRNNITAAYKQDSENTITRINKDTYNTAKKLKIQDRVGKLEPKNCYVLLKDHKRDFISRKPARLINPTKTELGQISKTILQNITDRLRVKLGYNLWISTKDSIDWFKKIPRKNKATFLQFDLINFYPSINKKILDQTIEFARKHIDIPDRDLEIIYNCRRGILCYEGENWIRKDTEENFDVPMGGKDSAQISDIIGLYILDCLGRVVTREHVGIYRDDGLMYIPNSNGPKTNQIHKKIQKVFDYIGFKVEISSNIRSANFLDVTFNLADGRYKPFSKNTRDPLYINVNSNHPKHIIKQIPNSVNIRINSISSDRGTFDNSKQPYNRALLESGHPPNRQLKYIQEDNKLHKKKKNRTRKVVWYNPPYCRLSSINIGRRFIDLVFRCFPEEHPLRKICNKSNLKISYSCCKNVDRIISAHNSKTLQEFREEERNSRTDEKHPICNCKDKTKCPLKGKCRYKNVVYLAELNIKEDPRFKRYYIGISMHPFKDRHYVHVGSFKNENSENHTSLSKKFWQLKKQRRTPMVSWSILTIASTPRNLRDKCMLCLEERKHILMFKQPRFLLNKRNEMTTKCPHTRDLTRPPQKTKKLK